MGLGEGPEQFLGSSASLLLGMGKPCLAHSFPEHPCTCRDRSWYRSGVTGGVGIPTFGCTHSSTSTVVRPLCLAAGGKGG